jgi:hypothetical protein
MENEMKRWCWLLGLAMLAACSDNGTDPDDGVVPDAELQFLRFENANAVTVRQASFWAVAGQGRKLEIDYANGEEFLEFEVRDKALLRRPNGTLFLPGDSILITVTLDASNRFIVHFEPSGLLFNPLDPAHLEINYKQADRDIDEDGDEDDHDRVLEAQLRFWQQERIGLPWTALTTLRIDDDDLETNLTSFTGFAMASN